MITSILLTAVLGQQQLPTVTVRIEGDGFLRFAKGTDVLYARQAKLTATNQGMMTTDGAILIPRLVAPAGTTKVEVSLDGTVTASLATGHKQLGRLVIAVFDAKAGFTPVGRYVSTSVHPTLTNPGEWIAGVIRTTPLVATKQPSTAPTKAPGTGTTQTAAEGFAKAAASVTINMNSQIDSDHVLLGDIAKIEGDPELKDKLSAVDFGKAPILGSKRGFTVTHVRANILANKIDLSNIKVFVPDGASVERKCQRVAPTDISKAVSDQIKAKYGFECSIREKTRVYESCVPVGKLTLDVSQFTTNNNDISVVVDITVDGKICNTVRATYEMQNMPGVKRGDVVRLRLISHFASVEVSAKANSNAFLGQPVSVQTDTGTIHNGVLVSPNTVEVKL